MNPFSPPRHAGFTLLEVMIVAVIVSLLAALAYPSYTEYVRRGNRAEARSAIMRMAQYQERNFSDRGAYVEVKSDTTDDPWKSLKYSGPSANQAKYDITVGNDGTVTATVSASNAIGDAECSPLTLAVTGIRGAHGKTSDSTDAGVLSSIAKCWK